MRRELSVVLTALAVAACAEDNEARPDPTGAGGANPTSGTSVVSSGQGGAPTSTGQGGEGPTTSSVTSTSSSTSTTGTGGNGEGGGQMMQGGGWESGTRLKAQSYVGSDGSRAPTYTMFDSMLNTACNFQLADDEQYRCLPQTGATVAGYYSDPACTQRVALATNCAATALYATEGTGSTCTYKYKVYSLGAQIFPTTLYVGAACTAWTPPSQWSYYTVTGELPPSTFVAATVQQEP